MVRSRKQHCDLRNNNLLPQAAVKIVQKDVIKISFLAKRWCAIPALEDGLEDIFFEVFAEALRIPARCCRSLTMVWSLENHLYLLTLDCRAIVNLNCPVTRLTALNVVKLCVRFVKKNSRLVNISIHKLLISNFFYPLTSIQIYNLCFLKQFKNNFKISREL